MIFPLPLNLYFDLGEGREGGRAHSITTPFKFSSGSGNFIFSPSSLSTRIEEMTRSRYHLWLAGTMIHGAASVLVLFRTSSYACMYSGHNLRSSRSPRRNFQCLFGSSR